MRSRILIALAVALPLSPAFAQQDRCKDILANGVWDYRLDVNDTRNVKAFLNWFGSTDAGSSASSKKQNFTTGGMYYGISGELGLSNDEQKNQEFFSKLEKLNTGYEQYDSTVINFVKTASPIIAKAWSDCMDGVAGLSASLKLTDNSKDIIVEMRYKPIDGKTNARVTLHTPEYVRCQMSGKNSSVSVTNSGLVVPCIRKTGDPGAITLASDTVIYPDHLLRFPAVTIRNLLQGKYANCDVFEDIKNGKDTLGPPEKLPNVGGDMGGGTPTPGPVALEAPPGYYLTNVAPHCEIREKPDACNFVHHGDPGDIQWTIPNRKAEIHPSTDGPRVTVWLSGTKQKIEVGVDRLKHPLPLLLYFGRSVSVEFPDRALDVKLYCSAKESQRIFSLSDLQKEGDQIYLKGIRKSPTGQIMEIGVLPFYLTE